jgi:type IV pilus assembly protein PilB
MTGYRGRLAIQEVLPIDAEIRELIMNNTSTSYLQNFVREKGLKFLIDDGLLKVKEGLTTTEEILRVAVLE